MKRLRSRLAIILAMVMVITSFTFLGAYADDEPVTVECKVTYQAGEGGKVTPEEEGPGPISGSKAEPNSGYTFSGWYKGDTEITKDATIAPSKVKENLDKDEETGEYKDTTFTAKFSKIPAPQISGLTALASCESVYLRWSDPTYTTAVTVAVNGAPSAVTATKRADGLMEYKVSGLNPRVNYLTGQYPSYSFTVTASNDGGSATGSTTGAPVKTISYKLQVKASGTLKSHGGPKAKIKVKKGQTIYAYGFGGGKYIFANEQGSIFYCNMSRTGKKSCVYDNSMYYTPEEAQLYVNDRGMSSKTSSFVWVNTYSQKLYVFTLTANGWTWVHDNKCSTGKASTPAPTGVSGKKQIWKKIKKRHGIKWWSPYSDINSIHSKKKAWKIGVPTSNGCIRNYEPDAKFVYFNAPIGTRVHIY